MEKKNKGAIDKSFVVGAIALAFLALGYQTAIFVHRAAVSAVVAHRDAPDTVYVVETVEIASPEAKGPGRRRDGSSAAGAVSRRDTIRRNSSHSAAAEKIASAHSPRHYESFRFNPNTVSIEDLQRLGFTLRQAQAIDNYRRKGGRFWRKGDFAKSYVVADSVYRRLEPYIVLPQLDINLADSAAFDALPGIGPYFASKMVEYRRRLRGYSHTRQLMEIYRFDEERFASISDLVCVDSSTRTPYPLWTLPEDSLALHPYIGPRAARSIVLLRTSTPPSSWTMDALLSSRILPPSDAERLSKCLIANP